MRIVSVTLTILLALAAIGCNTVQGVGKDIEKVGESIQKKAGQ